MYRIVRGSVVVGQTRLEKPDILIGHAQGAFFPAADFEPLRDRVAAIRAAIEAELAAEVQSGNIPADWANDFRDMEVLGDGRHRAAWADLSVSDPAGRVVNARVDGFAESDEERWSIGVTINDATYWRRAADRTL
jgi:hypothetical protein